MEAFSSIANSNQVSIFSQISSVLTLGFCRAFPFKLKVSGCLREAAAQGTSKAELVTALWTSPRVRRRRSVQQKEPSVQHTVFEAQLVLGLWGPGQWEI